MNILTCFKATKLTDNEFIEKLRDSENSTKKFARLSLLFCSVGSLALALLIVSELYKVHELVRETASQAPVGGFSILEAFDAGVAHGFSLGAGSAFFLVQAVIYFGVFLFRFNGSRERRLLLSYHDNLKPAGGG